MSTIPEHLSPSPQSAADDPDEIARLVERHGAQRAAFHREGPPPLEERIALLGALAHMVLASRTEIEEAMATDFGGHARPLTDLTEVLGVAGQAQYVMEKLPAWMQDQPRDTDANVLGDARATMRFQPKGVVGVLSPWNFPFLLSLGPLIDIIAAGNRAILKPSEVAPSCSELLRRMVQTTFDPDQVAVVCGGVQLAERFTSIPWDHLLYTGNTAVGREVAMAAARNLVPVTLELGGKNPALVLPGAVSTRAVGQIVGNKMVKSGQVCISPDYALVPRAEVRRFVDLAREFVEARTPRYRETDDCTGIITDRHTTHLWSMLQEAREGGAEVVPLGSTLDDGDRRRLPPVLVLDPSDDTRLMQDEIFGPILPIKPYDDIDGAIEYINDGDRPLGLYVFGDELEAEQVLHATYSGGACINTCAVQGIIPSLGFGGSGASGIGRHRGFEGFREFSNQRGVVVRGESDMIDAFLPPYSGMAKAIADAVFNPAR